VGSSRRTHFYFFLVAALSHLQQYLGQFLALALLKLFEQVSESLDVLKFRFEIF